MGWNVCVARQPDTWNADADIGSMIRKKTGVRNADRRRRQPDPRSSWRASRDMVVNFNKLIDRLTKRCSLLLSKRAPLQFSFAINLFLFSSLIKEKKKPST